LLKTWPRASPRLQVVGNVWRSGSRTAECCSQSFYTGAAVRAVEQNKIWLDDNFIHCRKRTRLTS